MNEFMSNPEAQTTELAEIRIELTSLEKMLSRVDDGSLEAQGKEEAVKAIRDRQTKLKQRAYSLHLSLKDYDGIKASLVDSITLGSEEREELGMPYYIEEVIDETFAIDADNLEALNLQVQEIVRSLKDEYGLMSFEDNAEEE